MPGPIAFRNGEFLPATQLYVPVYDAGFVLGVTVAEQIRSFGGKLFRLDAHLDRLEHSLGIIEMPLPVPREQLAAAALTLVAENLSLLAEGDDLGLCLFVTPGPYPTMAPPGEQGPTIAMHTYPVPFHLFSSKYQHGQALQSTSVSQIPAETLPRELKCRSRMHYYLADREAASQDPHARALMLDADGSVLETTTANVLIYRPAEGLISPPPERILPGISVAATLEIADRLEIPHTYREISLEDFTSADEALMTSTSVCVLPVVSLNGQPVGAGEPGPIFRQLLLGWSDLTGVDIAEQAIKFARR